jgi:hypothetical protein
MKISKTHQRFADRYRISTPRALSHPDEFLGPNWKDVLNFWLYLDTLSDEQLNMARRRFWNLDDADRVSSWELAWDASREVTSNDISNRAYMSTPASASDAGATATRELIGAHKILEQGKSLIFVPLFLDL